MGEIWILFGGELSRESETVFKAQKKLRKWKECPIKFVLRKNGEVLRNEERIMARWREYFLDLLNVDPKNSDVTTTVADEIVTEKDTGGITLNEMSDCWENEIGKGSSA